MVDCANGAASDVAPEVLRSPRRRRSTVLHAEPDGTNINDGCGSTHPEALQAAVVAAGADVGLAFDGDADRVLAVDETGELVDGDQIIALLRHRPAATGACCADDTVVVTVMTNLGFRLAMADARHRRWSRPRSATATCSRRSSAAGWSLGGEQSGHIIFRDLATTGDGAADRRAAARPAWPAPGARWPTWPRRR